MKGQVNRVDKGRLAVPSWARRVLFWAAIILLVIHLFTPQVKLTVDGVSVALLVAACLPWLLDRISGLKVGDVEISLSDVQEPVKELEAAAEKGEVGKTVQMTVDAVVVSAKPLVPDTSNPVALFAVVRWEIERRLKELAALRGTSASQDIRTTARMLVVVGAMPIAVYEALQKYLTVANAAIHGADVSSDAMDEARSSAPTVLAVLDGLIVAASRQKQPEGEDKP